MTKLKWGWPIVTGSIFNASICCSPGQIGNLISSDLNSRDTSTLIIWIIDMKESFKQALSIDFDSVGPLISQEQHDGMVKM